MVGNVDIDAATEELYPGLTFQWIFNHKAFAFYAENSTRSLTDAWSNKISEIARTWPENCPLFVLNDFSGKDCVVTPYNQQKNRDLMKTFPHLRFVTALVVKQSLRSDMEST